MACSPDKRSYFSVLLLAALAVGCQPEDEIVSYTVPKQPASVQPAAKLEDQRMLGAMVSRGNQTWYFKLTGPLEAVSDQEAPFREFVASIRFENESPAWQLPEGWTAEKGTGMRFATITVPENLELSVIPLPSGDGDPREATLANVNRWRGQLALPPLELSELDDNVEELALAEGNAVVVDLVGKAPAGGPMMPPFAGGATPPFDRPAPTAPEAPVELSFETPEDWSQGEAGGLRKAAFEIARSGLEAEVTVIDLAAAAGELLPNVNRWRGQVGLKEIDSGQLGNELEEIEVDGNAGHYVEIVGPTQTILGAIVLVGERAWFFKLQGDNELAASEKSRFKSFVTSTKFRE